MNAPAAWVPGLGPLESAIMTVIWDADQPLSVQVARERMDYQSTDGEDPAYTTVMTVMVVLWRKGFLDRTKRPGAGHRRAWWYAARISREDHLATVIRQHLPAHPTRRPSCAEPPCRRGDVAPALAMPGHRS
jgi:predicted transcriptional regulator